MCLSSGMPPRGPPDAQHQLAGCSSAPHPRVGGVWPRGGMGTCGLDAVCGHTRQPDGLCNFSGKQTGPFLGTEMPVFLPAAPPSLPPKGRAKSEGVRRCCRFSWL